MWLYIQTWLPLLTIALTAVICFSVVSFIMGRQSLRLKLMVYKPNRSTPNYLFEKTCKPSRLNVLMQSSGLKPETSERAGNTHITPN
jgi:hypothetical protein